LRTALAVDLERVERVAVARDLPRRQVHHRVGALEGLLHRLAVEDRAFEQPEARVLQDRLEVGERPVREVVDAGNAVASGDQPLGQVRTDETGHAGHGDLQKALNPRKRAEL
jgi:hypothetical protein